MLRLLATFGCTTSNFSVVVVSGMYVHVLFIFLPGRDLHIIIFAVFAINQSRVPLDYNFI